MGSIVKCSNEADKKKKYLLISIACVAIFFRIWLSARSDLMIIPGSILDDYLQVMQSSSLYSGNWLGTQYNNIVLAKNQGFPLFLSICRIFRVSYVVGYGVLVVISSALMCLSVRPIIRKFDPDWTIALILFVAIMYTPLPVSATSRVYRNAITPWMALLSLACGIGIYAYKEFKALRYVWAIIGCVCTGFFSIVREDSVWIMPALFFVMLSAVIEKTCQNGRHKEIISDNGKQLGFTNENADKIHKGKLFYERKNSARTLCVNIVHILLPYIILLMGIPLFVNTISLINKHHYGIYTINDRTKTNITRVMKDLYRIDDGDPNRDKDAWLSLKAVELAMRESKTLAEINYTTSYIGWAGGENIEIKGDHPEWVLRAAAESAGYYRDAVETDQLYIKIADELEEAFESGRLKKQKGIMLSSQTGVFTIQDFIESFQLSLLTLWEFSHYAACEPSYESVNIPDTDWQDLSFWESALGMVIPKSQKQLDDISAAKELRMSNRADIYSIKRSSHIQSIICKIYRAISYPLFIVSCVFFIISTFMMITRCRRRCELSGIWVALMTIVLAGSVDLYAVVLFSRWISREPANYSFGFYASSTYLCLTVFMYLSFAVLVGIGVKVIRIRYQRKKGKDINGGF